MASTYAEALAQLNDEQRRAVTQLDGPVLVIAGPGTGKTQLLTTRIAHILAKTDTLPENILCLTFTDSGVTAMRERLSSLISSKAAYDVSISTYHAFGNDLIKRYPDYFMDFNDRELTDELGSYTILREVIADLPYNSPLKYADNYINNVISFISDCKQNALSPKQLRKVLQQNKQFLEQAAPIVSEVIGNLPRMSKSSIGLFEQLNVRFRALDLPTEAPAARVTPLFTIALQELETALAHAKEAGSQQPLTTWKNNWLEKDTNNIFTIGGKHTQARMLAATDIYEQYQAELAARGLYDYDDIILAATHALERNNEFRFSLQEKYLYILLDEFQDTNGAQFKLVQLLTNNPSSEGRPDIMAVGDDDQTIYAFQGANYSNLGDFQKLYREVLPITLVDNYRSQSAILETSHGIASQIEARFTQDKVLVPKAKPAKQTTVERVEAKSDIEQYGWITKKILDIQDSGVPLSEIAVLAPKHRYLEPLVAFLRNANIPVHYEKRENILDDPAITELMTMSKLVIALKAGKREAVDTLWPEVLSYDCWDIATSRIWELSWQAYDDHHDWTSKLLDSELRPLALFFMRLSMLCEEESLEMMLDYLVGIRKLELHEPGIDEPYTSPFYQHYFGTVIDEIASTNQQALPLEEHTEPYGKFWELLTNLTVLRAKLSEYRRDLTALHLSDLIEFIEAHRQAEIKIMNTSPYHEATDAVQLMTAFKSKGLEFETVFVIACNDDVWGGGSHGQGSRLGLPANLKHIRYDGGSDDERLRLLYVAMTRAKSQLYLVNYTATHTGKAISRLRYLEEQVDNNGHVISPLLPQESQQVRLATNSVAPPPIEEMTAYWQGKHVAALSKETLVNLIRARLTTYQLSPTAVGQFTDMEYGGPEQFLLYNILHFPHAPTPEIQYGNAIHETLQWIHLRNKEHKRLPTLDDVIERFASRLQTRQLIDQTIAQLLERGKPVLKAYLEQRAHTISPDNECEYNFRNEGVFIGEAHMSGKIDKLIIDKENKELVIVDYKTGNSHTKWQHTTKLHKYKQQLYLYKLLVERSHTFAGYTVTGAYVEFVEPDDNGIINELAVTFDREEQARLEQLTDVIWEIIHTLQLPETSTFRKDIYGTEAFEKFLLNGIE